MFRPTYTTTSQKKAHSITSTNQKKNNKTKKTPPPTKITQTDSTNDKKPAAKKGSNKDTSPSPAVDRFQEPKTYQDIRYRGIIDVPPSEKPFQEFVTLLKQYLDTVQKTLSKSIYLAPWDKEQEATFPLLKKKEDIPDSRESLGIYLGTYINPKEDGSKVYINLRWATFKEPPVPLERFGMELSDALAKLNMSMNRQPQPCQAVKSSCIGWFM